jgi:hypothetical protein
MRLTGRVRIDASLGTGRTEASLGTGKTEAIGWGQAAWDACSSVRARTNASVGNGPYRSISRHWQDRSIRLGTGPAWKPLSVRGRTNASAGTGRMKATTRHMVKQRSSVWVLRLALDASPRYGTLLDASGVRAVQKHLSALQRQMRQLGTGPHKCVRLAPLLSQLSPKRTCHDRPASLRRRSYLWARHPLLTRTTSQFHFTVCRKLAPARPSTPGALVVRGCSFEMTAGRNRMAAWPH